MLNSGPDYKAVPHFTDYELGKNFSLCRMVNTVRSNQQQIRIWRGGKGASGMIHNNQQMLHNNSQHAKQGAK